MAKYKKFNGHWELLPSSKEADLVREDIAQETMESLKQPFATDKLSSFVRADSPSDFTLTLFIPRYYNDGTKISEDVIAEILFKISESVGGASTWGGKGYFTEDNILYVDKNIYANILLRQFSPERATLFGKYLSSAIGKILQQEASLYILAPALSDFVSKEDYDTNIKEALERVEDLNVDEGQYED